MADEKETITKDMGIMDVVQKHPESGEVFVKYGMHCLGCMAAKFENIEQGAKAHGMDDAKVEEMVAEINKAIKKE